MAAVTGRTIAKHAPPIHSETRVSQCNTAPTGKPAGEYPPVLADLIETQRTHIYKANQEQH